MLLFVGVLFWFVLFVWWRAVTFVYYVACVFCVVWFVCVFCWCVCPCFFVCLFGFGFRVCSICVLGLWLFVVVCVFVLCLFHLDVRCINGWLMLVCLFVVVGYIVLFGCCDCLCVCVCLLGLLRFACVRLLFAFLFVLLFPERKHDCLFCLWLVVLVLFVFVFCFCICVSMLFACFLCVGWLL